MNSIPKNSPSKHTGVSRRGFLAGAAALTFAIGASGLIKLNPAQAASTAGDINAWIRIGTDNSANLIFPITEMGQGSSTALPMILAEELDADWDLVEVEQLHRDDRTYGNPLFGNVLYTAGSTGVYAFFDVLRKAGAQARAYLMQVAANHWGVEASELDTWPSVVLHPASGRRISYGEIVALDASGIEMPDAETVALKDPANYRLIGSDTKRLDIPSKSNGTAVFAYDVQLDGMLYAVVERAPVEGETANRVNATDALSVPGVVEVVELPDGVAVVAETHYAARQGRDMLDITWSESAPARGHDSDQAILDYSAAATDLSQGGAAWAEKGNAASAVEGAARQVEATYLSDHAYHAQIEPMAAVAQVDEDGKGAEIWVGSQTQSWSTRTVTETLGTTPERVKLNMMTMGGGFGRRTELNQNYVRDALLTSKATGRPVKVLWSREDDVRFGAFRPAAAQHMRAGLDERSRLAGWHHRVAAPSVIAYFNPLRWSQVGPKDIITMRGSESKHYTLPDMLAEHVVTDRVARIAPWRGIGASYTSFAAEAFMDELAEAAGKDPIDFRLDLLNENPRGRALLLSVAERSGWGRPAGETALGVAFAGYGDSMAAGVAEISLDRDSGVIKLEKFWAAVDAGLVISPNNSLAQIEGGIVFGMSSSLRERVVIKDGQVEQSNFWDYEIIRNNEVPEIDIDLKVVDAPPSGMGEVGTPMVAPAIANAFHALTGKRIRHLPFTPERVLEVLEA